MTAPTPSRAPEAKVVSAVVGGLGAGGTVGTFILWLLGVTAWGASADATQTGVALNAVPGPVSALVLLAVSALGSGIAGYLAPHTPRPMQPVPPLDPPAV